MSVNRWDGDWKLETKDCEKCRCRRENACFFGVAVKFLLTPKKLAHCQYMHQLQLYGPRGGWELMEKRKAGLDQIREYLRNRRGARLAVGGVAPPEQGRLSL